MKTDIEIAQATPMLPIDQVAAKAGIDCELLEHYGKYKAKLDITGLKNAPRKGKLILVTAINPTPAGEGKDHHHASVWQTHCAQSGQEHRALPCGSPLSAPCSA